MKETSSFDGPRDKVLELVLSPEHLDIPIEHVIGMQQAMMRAMVPEFIKPYVTQSDGQNIDMEEALMMRWVEKYSRYFREYCDQFVSPHTDEEVKLKERLISGQLTSDDYVEIQKYLQDPVRHIEAENLGGPFFANEAEEQEFLKQFVH